MSGRGPGRCRRSAVSIRSFATSATVQRARLLIGAEVGHYWIFDQKILDLSAYGKFVDNLVQNYCDITVSLGAQSITFQGIGEGQYGMDAGASASPEPDQYRAALRQLRRQDSPSAMPPVTRVRWAWSCGGKSLFAPRLRGRGRG